ncbi:hypothetical protein HK097_006195, partial [Rhizophlyctis rosea]
MMANAPEPTLDTIQQSHTLSSYDPYSSILATVTQRVKEGLAQATDERKQDIKTQRADSPTSSPSTESVPDARSKRATRFMDDDSDDEDEHSVDELGWEEDHIKPNPHDTESVTLHPFRTDLDHPEQENDLDDDLINAIPTTAAA